MFPKKRHILASVLSAAAFIVVAAIALYWCNAQITDSLQLVLGNEAKGYASVAAQNIHLSDQRVTELENMTYAELLESDENKQLQEFFDNATLKESIDYAYVMVEIPSDKVRYHVDEQTADNFAAPLGTPLDIMWLLDVNVGVASSDVGNGAVDELQRFGYRTAEDEKVFAEAPLYTVVDDEWGRHICGYAPLYSEEGTYIGVVGVALSVDVFDQQAAVAVEVLVVLLFVIVVVLCIIFFLMNRRHRKDEFEMHLQEERYRILINNTNTLTFDYDPLYDTLTYTSYGKKGRVEEHTVKQYQRHLDNVTSVPAEDLDKFSTGIEDACATSGFFVQDFRADMGEGLRWYKARFVSLADDSDHVYRIIGLLDDVQDAKETEHRADRDQLSGVFNRSGARSRVDDALEDTTKSIAFILFDIDDFKTINDTYGHAGGDEVIRHIGAALSATFRRDDITYRLGGDEFAVLIQTEHDIEELARLKADSMLQDVAAYSEQLDWDFTVSLSIGIALSDGGCTFEDLYQTADEALYRAKRKGKNRYELTDNRKGPLS